MFQKLIQSIVGKINQAQTATKPVVLSKLRNIRSSLNQLYNKISSKLLNKKGDE